MKNTSLALKPPALAYKEIKEISSTEQRSKLLSKQFRDNGTIPFEKDEQAIMIKFQASPLIAFN